MTTSGCCCVERIGMTWSAGRCWPKPGSINPHTKFGAEVYVLTKEEGGQAHAVFQGIPAAVLLPDDGCDGIGASCRREWRW